MCIWIIIHISSIHIKLAYYSTNKNTLNLKEYYFKFETMLPFQYMKWKLFFLKCMLHQNDFLGFSFYPYFANSACLYKFLKNKMICFYIIIKF